MEAISSRKEVLTFQRWQKQLFFRLKRIFVMPAEAGIQTPGEPHLCETGFPFSQE
jgi:hypothetical protein